MNLLVFLLRSPKRSFPGPSLILPAISVKSSTILSIVISSSRSPTASARVCRGLGSFVGGGGKRASIAFHLDLTLENLSLESELLKKSRKKNSALASNSVAYETLA